MFEQHVGQHVILSKQSHYWLNTRQRFWCLHSKCWNVSRYKFENGMAWNICL